jgi:hypothetical protein
MKKTSSFEQVLVLHTPAWALIEALTVLSDVSSHDRPLTGPFSLGAERLGMKA